MNIVDAEDALKTMHIIADTREQDTNRARRRYAAFGCPVDRAKLDFGDYSALFYLPDNKVFTLADKASVERKMNLDELCMCFCQARKRFTREFERANAAGARIYLLVEGASWEDAYAGKYRSQMSPEALVASMTAWMARYDCHIIMCDEETTGRLIRDILYREGKERLMKMAEGSEDG